MDWSRRGFRRPASGRRRASGREQLEFIMAGKTKDREFRHPDVAAYLRGLTGEAAKRSLVIREPDGVCTEYWREGGRVRCREVGAGEASGGPAPELRALLAAAEAAFGRSLPRMKAEPGGGRVPDPAPSGRRSATACWIPGRGAARPFWRRSTPSFRPRPARAAAGRWSGTAGSGRRSWRASDGPGSSANTSAAASAAAAISLWTGRWAWRTGAPRPGRKASLPTPPAPKATRRLAASSTTLPASGFRSRRSGAMSRGSAGRSRSSSGRTPGSASPRRRRLC